MEASWSNTPADILHQIALKLISVEDLLAFSVVCHPWHSAYMHVKSKWIPLMPWMMLEEPCTKEHPCRLQKFYDPMTTKCYQFKPLETLVCWGSPYGWIVAMDMDFEIFMFNPLTGAHVKLPSAYTLPKPLNPELVKDKVYNRRRLRWVTLDRLILLKIQRGDNAEEKIEEEFIVISVSGCLTSVGVCRPNDSTWTPILFDKKLKHVYNVAYRSGALFLLGYNGALFHVKLNDGVINERPLTSTYYLPPPPIRYDFEGAFGHNKLFLVESSGMLCVQLLRGSFETEERVRAPAYFVFKMNEETKVWENLKDPREISIFVDYSSAMAIQVRDSINWRQNCICFMGASEVGLCGSIVDNLDGYRFPSRPSQVPGSSYCCPFWFIPKL